MFCITNFAKSLASSKFLIKNHCEPLVAVWLRPSTTEPCICYKQVAEKPRWEHLKMMYVKEVLLSTTMFSNFQISVYSFNLW